MKFILVPAMENYPQINQIIVSDTKFSPDWWFRLLKQKFRRARVECLMICSVVKVVNESTMVNHAQLVGAQSREVVVPTYNSSNYLGAHRLKIPLITRQHCFQFLSTGEVIIHEYSNSPETELNHLKDRTCLYCTSFHNSFIWIIFRTPGIPLWKDQRILFCKLMCPNPINIHQISPHSPPSNASPPPKRQRTCCYCGHWDHDKRTCKNRESQ